MYIFICCYVSFSSIYVYLFSGKNAMAININKTEKICYFKVFYFSTVYIRIPSCLYIL